MSENPAYHTNGKKLPDFADVLREGTERFADATLAPPASTIRARGNRRRRDRLTVSFVGAAAAAGIAGVAFAGVPHRTAARVLPATSTSASSAKPNGVAIVVQPGETAPAVFQDLTARLGWSPAQISAAVAGGVIDLPAWSVVDGRPSAEGMLEPGSYAAVAADGPAALLRRMVDARIATLDRIGFVPAAAGLRCGTSPCTPEQALIIASLAGAVSTDPQTDSGLSEFVQQRLRADDVLGMDETAAYGLYPTDGRHPPITAAQAFDLGNPYSTGRRHGLPPGPIGNASDETLRAVLTPTHAGNYFYCVPAQGGQIEFFAKSQSSEWEKACI